MQLMDPNILAWAPYVVGLSMLMAFSWGRRVAFWLTIGLPLLLLGLLLASEPDFGD